MQPTIQLCHNHGLTDTRGVHICDKTCSMYPLQTCFNVCGVISLIMLAVLCLCESLYIYLTSNTKTKNTPYIYLTQPSKYNKYLRLCLIGWFSEERIKIEYIVPNGFSNQSRDSIRDIESDSDDDTDVERCEEELLSQQQKEPSMKEEPLAKTATTEIPVGTKDQLSSSTSSSTKDGKTRFQCQFCPSSLTRKSDLKRHIITFHGEDKLHGTNVESGKCVCMECGHKCHRIVDLRKHLIRSHKKIFRMEKLNFDKVAGKHLLIYMEVNEMRLMNLSVNC